MPSVVSSGLTVIVGERFFRVFGWRLLPEASCETRQTSVRTGLFIVFVGGENRDNLGCDVL